MGGESLGQRSGRGFGYVYGAYGCVTSSALWRAQRGAAPAGRSCSTRGRYGAGGVRGRTYREPEDHGHGTQDTACRWLGVGLGLHLWGALDGREAYSGAGRIDVGGGQRAASEQYGLRSQRLFCCHQGPTKHEIHHKTGNLRGKEWRGLVWPGTSVQAHSQGPSVYKHQIAGEEGAREAAKGRLVLEAAGVGHVRA